MSSEYSPISNSADGDRFYVEIIDDGILPEFLQKNKILRYTLFSISGVLLFIFIYFMVIELPSLAPVGVQIPDISMVKKSEIYLHPIIPEKKKGKSPDPDDPIKVIPDFKKLEYVPDSNISLQKHIAKLDISNKTMKKRMILIGDVHGCLKQLKNLLERVCYDGGKNDHVILLGDFTNKGPESIEVINYAIEHNIECTLGNHELAMMKRYTQFHGLKPPIFRNEEEFTNSTLSIRETYDLDQLMKLAKKLTPEHINFLGKCSPIVKIGPVPHYTDKKQKRKSLYPADGVAVHAGLLWNKGIHHQDVEEVTTIRNLLPPDWKIPTDNRHDKVSGEKSVAWTKIWNEHQLENYEKKLKTVTDKDLTIGTKVYYGHDAKRGVAIKEFSNGLDSGCVYGKQLTAAIIWSQLSTIDGAEKIIYQQMNVDVNC